MDVFSSTAFHLKHNPLRIKSVMDYKIYFEIQDSFFFAYIIVILEENTGDKLSPCQNFSFILQACLYLCNFLRNSNLK